MGVLKGDFSVINIDIKFQKQLIKTTLIQSLFIQRQVLNLSAGCKSKVFKRFNQSQFEVPKNSVL